MNNKVLGVVITLYLVVFTTTESISQNKVDEYTLKIASIDQIIQ